MRNSILGLAAASMIGVAIAAPASAQQGSLSYQFLEAVKKRKGDEVIKMLATPGTVLVNSRQMDGDGALHIVTRGRDLAWLEFLLSKGARPDLQTREGDTPLMLAAQLGWVDGADALLKRRAAVDLANSRGETPLIRAVQKRDVAMVRLLLSRGANPKRTDSVAGYSALDYARQDSRAGMIAKTLEEAATKPVRPVQGPKL